MSAVRWFRTTRGIPWRKRLRHHVNLVRWTLDRCAHCGHRFAWKRDARHSYGHSDGKVWHGSCMALEMWQRKAEERLKVVDVMSDLSGLTGSDVCAAMNLRADNGQPGGGSSAWDLAWRVFYDLGKEAGR